MWYQGLVEIENPGREELHKFIHLTRGFLGEIVNGKGFRWLWEDYGHLRELAIVTYNRSIAEGPGLEIDQAIFEIPQVLLERHGLSAESLHFKFSVIATLDEELYGFLPDQFDDDQEGGVIDWVKRNFSIREWFKKLITAIDATLDSILKCADWVMPGVGGIIKEFKDTIVSIA
tara:strand:- start:195 stop:716 length:522 start_codon:yes stop_codon:yes gene_type:complete